MSHDTNDVEKMVLVVNIGPAKTRVNRARMISWIRSFATYDIIIALRQKM